MREEVGSGQERKAIGGHVNEHMTAVATGARPTWGSLEDDREQASELFPQGEKKPECLR